ncbi:hypothetical protein LQL77_32455, partial [Rhodococcus cerastii]|nr:hypothetical protein [Rhodococcus cerastii]
MSPHTQKSAIGEHSPGARPAGRGAIAFAPGAGEVVDDVEVADEPVVVAVAVDALGDGVVWVVVGGVVTAPVDVVAGAVVVVDGVAVVVVGEVVVVGSAPAMAGPSIAAAIRDIPIVEAVAVRMRRCDLALRRAFRFTDATLSGLDRAARVCGTCCIPY